MNLSELFNLKSKLESDKNNKIKEYYDYINSENSILNNELKQIIPDSDILITSLINDRKIVFKHINNKYQTVYFYNKTISLGETNIHFNSYINDISDSDIKFIEFNLKLIKLIKEEKINKIILKEKYFNEKSQNEIYDLNDRISEVNSLIKNEEIKLREEKIKFMFYSLKENSILIKNKENYVRRGRKYYSDIYSQNSYLIKKISKKTLTVDIFNLYNNNTSFSIYRSDMKLSISKFNLENFQIFNDFNSIDDYINNYLKYELTGQ